MNAYKDFGPFDGKIWLNVASEGPLPQAAMEALKDAVEWKLQPFQLTVPKFLSIPQQLKVALASLIHVDAQDIILGNSATYGIHLLANGLPLSQGDEVLVMQNDFPTNILPWMELAKKGVRVAQLKPQGHVLTLDEIASAVTPSTKVLCLSWIHSFSGHKIDAVKIGEFCREKGIIFILNCCQVIGAFNVNISAMPVDAIVCAGYKWLCGPYSTGFCWMKPQLREKLSYNHAYWQAVLDEHQLSIEAPIAPFELKTARHYDLFATANFFNFVPWTASIQYLVKSGMDRVAQYNQQLVAMIIERIDRNQFEFISPTEVNARTNLVVFTHKDPKNNPTILNKLKDAGIFLALWKGKLRVSPHIHNTRNDIDRFLRVLNSCLMPAQERHQPHQGRQTHQANQKSQTEQADQISQTDREIEKDHPDQMEVTDQTDRSDQTDPTDQTDLMDQSDLTDQTNESPNA